MKHSHFIIMFFIIFVGQALLILSELTMFFRVNVEKKKIDNAIEYAYSMALDTLSKYAYNEDREVIVKDSFVYAYSAYLEEVSEYELLENSLLVESIDFFVNGYPVEATELLWITDEDCLGLRIKLSPIMITAGNRLFYMNRTAEGEIKLLAE